MELLLLAQLAQPVPRLSSCPLGYYAQGAYCTPSAWTKRPAVERVGTSCPLGWYSQGGYCLRSR